MCLIIFRWDPDNARPLIVAANRDEFHDRPSLDAHYWKDAPHIFAGKDLEKNGTWLGLAKLDKSKPFKLAALTNFRTPDNALYTHSRGEITTNFLNSTQSAFDYAKRISFSQYPGFNGLFFDGTELVYCHHEQHKEAKILTLRPGNYGLSNAELDTAWPKVTKSKQALKHLDTASDNEDLSKHLMTYLRDRNISDDEHLPNTGIAIEVERMLSAPFIVSPQYGTRTSTIVVIEKQNLKQTVYFKESQFSVSGDILREQTKQLK